MQITPQQFLDLLKRADLVAVDEGPMLSHWDTSPVTGDVENQIARFSWTDGEYEYYCHLAENTITTGHIKDGTTFVCSIDDENDTEIRLFTASRLDLTQ